MLILQFSLITDAPKVKLEIALSQKKEKEHPVLCYNQETIPEEPTL